MGIILQAADEFNVNTPTLFYPFTQVAGEWQTVIDFPSTGVFTIGVQPLVSVEELIGANLKVYPNPIKDLLTIDWGSDIHQKWYGELYDQVGRKVFTFQHTERKASVFIPELSTGLYQLVIHTNESAKIVRSIVVE